MTPAPILLSIRWDTPLRGKAGTYTGELAGRPLRVTISSSGGPWVAEVRWGDEGRIAAGDAKGVHAAREAAQGLISWIRSEGSWPPLR